MEKETNFGMNYNRYEERPEEKLELERKISLPLSSSEFYIREGEEGGIFRELYLSEALSRLAGIKQLEYLISPFSKEGTEESLQPHLFYLHPYFHHTRRDHSILTAVLMKKVLARAGFSEKERAAPVLTAACHDIAMPAGGDATKRIDPENLDEEKNFRWVMEQDGLAEKWKKQFGFDVSMASEWVQNKHLIGKLLDVLDKISYTAVDCYHIGRLGQQTESKSKIVSLCNQYPLIMDVWQDIQFTTDKTNFGFSDPGRLFQFLLLRVHEHKETLFNPDSLTLSYFFKQKTQLLYEKGIITKEQLLTKGDEWLLSELNKHYPEEIKGDVVLQPIYWKKFSTAEEQKKFAAQIGDSVIDLAGNFGFNLGLDLPVINPDKETITPIGEVISEEKIDELEEISKSTKGYYVYYEQKNVKEKS